MLLIEPIPAVDFCIDIYGAGHVGKALVQVLSSLPCQIRWIDSRAEQFPDAIPANVAVIISDTPELEADDAPAGSYILVMSHSHPLDQAICERFLRRGAYRYLGLIGSASKKRKFQQRLRRAGIDDEQWATLTCPIGIDGIDGKQPAEIAIAVAAELLRLRQSSGITGLKIKG
jgi:xanthine dehydrogenase accessory factor